MAMQSVMSIASNAMALESQRISYIANNIAHQNDISQVGSQMYKAQHLVSSLTNTDSNNFNQSLSGAAQVLKSMDQALTQYLPNHPLANDKGMVQLANIDTTQEMLLLMKAKHAYSANLKMFILGRSLYNHAFDIAGAR